MESISYQTASCLHKKKSPMFIGVESSEGGRNSFSEMRANKITNISDFDKFLLFDNEYDYFVWLYPSIPKSSFSGISKEKIAPST